MTPPLRSALVGVLAGATLLLVGLAVGQRWLPAGRTRALPAQPRFTAEFRDRTRLLGVVLSAGEPRVRLMTPVDEVATTYQLLGAGADGWIDRHGHGLEVEISQAAQWGEALGRLTVDFSATGEPWRALWAPATLTGFFSSRGRPERLCELLLLPGESLGSTRDMSTSLFFNQSVTAIVGATEPAHLYRFTPQGQTGACGRRPGTLEVGALHVAGNASTSEWIAEMAPLVLVVFAFVLFVILALRARIDLWNGLLLAVVFLVTVFAGDWPSTVPEALQLAVGAPATAVWLLFLWSSAESWARSRLPNFSTTLDILRRGRLGARGGRALLAGWAGGAGLAGLRLALLALGVVLPGIDPAGPAASLPLFAFSGHPLMRAIVWVGALVLMVILGRRAGRRWEIPLVLLVVPLFVTPLALAPWLAQYAAGVLLTAGLLWVFRRYGLTASLVAALLAFVLPTAALALRYASWVPASASVAALIGLVPLVAGFVGLHRGERVEHDPGAVPEFVRREERERRLTYEMDLLSRMQLGLLPQGLPRLPGYEVTARSILATEAGGDLYDFLRDERGRLWIAAGDVSGHGYSCAIGHATIKAALLSLVDGNATPSRILDRVDRVVRASSFGSRQFVTLCLVCLEEATGRLLVANAGHPFPLLAAPREAPRELEIPGLPLGQGPPRRYHDLEVTLPKGGVLLLYSDGLYEATDPNGVEYGFASPCRVLADSTAWNAAEVLERLLFDWRRHLAGNAPADDTTLVVLKRQ